jgi:hypothetical protein
MNSSVYLRKKLAQMPKTIGFQNGQDASQVTLKNQARAQQITDTSVAPLSIPVSFSKNGGSVANILQTSQQTCTPTDQSCSSGYQTVVSGRSNVDTAATKILSAQHCAICSDAPSSAPYSVTIPCGIFINPIAYNAPPQNINDGTATSTIDPTIPTPGTKPAALQCCGKDMSQLYRDNSELIADQGRQLSIRTAYNLPAKLQGLRGPVVGR